MTSHRLNGMTNARLFVLTAFAMIPLAANSWLARAALREYALWYTVVPLLRAATAATVQLSVPVIVAVGGVILLSEPLTLRLVLAMVAVLGGIGLVIRERQRRQN